MKAQVIQIDSLEQGTQVTIRNGYQRPSRRLFPNIDEAFDYVLPRGNRRTTLRLNGYNIVPHAWVQDRRKKFDSTLVLSPRG